MLIKKLKTFKTQQKYLKQLVKIVKIKKQNGKKKLKKCFKLNFIMNNMCQETNVSVRTLQFILLLNP